MVLGKIQCHLDNSRAKIISEQGPIVLAVGAGGDGFSRLSFLFSFSFSLGDGLKFTEILSFKAVKSKKTNQPSMFFYKLIFYYCNSLPTSFCNSGEIASKQAKGCRRTEMYDTQ